MSEIGNLQANVRKNGGKGVARTLRREGRVPAVLYGAGQDNVALALSPRDLERATDAERSWNTMYTLTISEPGKSDVVQPAVIADIQVHPVRREVMHIDFMRVDPTADVVRKIPVRYEGRSVGVVKGGKLKKYRRVVKVASKPNEVPVELVVDVSSVDGGESLRMKDMTLTKGRLIEPAEARLCYVEVPKARKEEEDAGAKGKKK